MEKREGDIVRWGIKEEEVLGCLVVTEHHPINDCEKICGFGCK
jgi:hypothetical protein